MLSCPICDKHQVVPTPGRLSVLTLSEHLQSDHATAPCFQGAQKARPWRCPLCPGGRRNYASAEGLAKHLLKEHASATAQTADVPTPPPASVSRPASAPPTPEAIKPYKTEPSEPPLQVPCLPWLPRPKWLLRPPSATLLLATWNLEHFSVGSADSSTVARKVAHICETLRTLCSREGPDASVVVALQEVFCCRAVSFLASYLTEKDAAEGGSGRVWHGATSEPLGNNPERAAFLWAGPPPQQRQQQQRGVRRAPLHVDTSSSFQLLRKEDLDTVVGGQRVQQQQQQLQQQQQQQQQPQQQPLDAGKGPGHFIRSPFYGLFRVGYANLLLVNVHLAAEAAAARSELSALHHLADAIQRPNCRLLRRHSLGGCLRGRKPRGLVAILGDFNCPISRRAIPVAGTATPPPPPRSGTPTGAPPSPAARGGSSTASEIRAAEEARGATLRTTEPPGAVAEGREPQQQRRQRQQEPGPATAATSPQRGEGQGANGQANGGGYGGANGPSWEAFLRNGWVNALCPDANDSTANGNTDGNGNGQGHGAGVPFATNWRAKQLKALDAICLPQTHGSLVTGRGVCPPPAHVDASQPGQYPNHLLCWVRLDLGPLQMAPGKVRPLLAPARLAAAAASTGAVSGSGTGSGAGTAATARAG